MKQNKKVQEVGPIDAARAGYAIGKKAATQGFLKPIDNPEKLLSPNNDLDKARQAIANLSPEEKKQLSSELTGDSDDPNKTSTTPDTKAGPGVQVTPVYRPGEKIKTKDATLRYTGIKGREWEVVGGNFYNTIRSNPHKDAENLVIRDQDKYYMNNSNADAKFQINKLNENKFYSRFLQQMI